MRMGSDGQVKQDNRYSTQAALPLLLLLLVHHFALSDLLSQTQDFVKTPNKKKDRPLLRRGALHTLALFDIQLRRPNWP